MRATFLAAVLVLLSASVSGATTEVDPEPGLMTAGSPLHGWDVAFDEALSLTPVSDPGDVAFERASEMMVAERRNNTEAFEKAAAGLNRTVERASERHRDGLVRAASVLESVNVSEEARQGISTALEQVRRAQNRTAGNIFFPDTGSIGGTGTGENRSASGGGVPDIEAPGGR